MGITLRRLGTRRQWLAFALLGVGAVIGPAALVWGSTWAAGHRAPSDLPAMPVAIVLGAGVDGDGRPSPFLDERIAVAVQLYRQGTVRALLMSGDNSRADYDEVGAMARRAQELGVPASAIATDHAGFDTYSSCYRARSVWAIDRAVVVSQPFHLGRAIWLCRQLGIDTVGAATGSDAVTETFVGWVREIPAIDKSVIDVLRHRSPIFPGPRDHTLDPVTGST
jgi:vancomycin permeability regulator SanA